MHREGSASWRFGHGDMGYLHTALFVRDAARLPVSPSPDIPPPLAGDVPDYADVLPSGQRTAAGQHWVVWWRRLVGQAAHEARQSATALPADTDPDDFEAIIRHRFGGQKEVFDPPDFESLVGLPSLQTAAISTFGPWGRWSHGQGNDGEGLEKFAWPVVRNAAETTAAELGIPIGELAGYAHVLDVEGMWSYLAAPGCALCSAAVACDPQAAAGLLREVFSSWPGRETPPPVA
jgi:hypothetical protein